MAVTRIETIINSIYDFVDNCKPQRLSPGYISDMLILSFKFAYRPVGSPANKETFRTIPSEISPGSDGKRSTASTMNDIACRLLCLDGATWREIKPPMQTLRSQLLF